MSRFKLILYNICVVTCLFMAMTTIASATSPTTSYDPTTKTLTIRDNNYTRIPQYNYDWMQYSLTGISGVSYTRQQVDTIRYVNCTGLSEMFSSTSINTRSNNSYKLEFIDCSTTSNGISPYSNKDAPILIKNLKYNGSIFPNLHLSLSAYTTFDGAEVNAGANQMAVTVNCNNSNFTVKNITVKSGYIAYNFNNANSFTLENIKTQNTTVNHRIAIAANRTTPFDGVIIRNCSLGYAANKTVLNNSTPVTLLMNNSTIEDCTIGYSMVVSGEGNTIQNNNGFGYIISLDSNFDFTKLKKSEGCPIYYDETENSLNFEGVSFRQVSTNVNNISQINPTLWSVMEQLGLTTFTIGTGYSTSYYSSSSLHKCKDGTSVSLPRIASSSHSSRIVVGGFVNSNVLSSKSGNAKTILYNSDGILTLYENAWVSTRYSDSTQRYSSKTVSCPNGCGATGEEYIRGTGWDEDYFYARNFGTLQELRTYEGLKFKFKDCTFNNVGQGASFGYQNHFISDWYFDDCTINGGAFFGNTEFTGCIFTNVAQLGDTFSDSKGTTLTNCSFKNTSAPSVYGGYNRYIDCRFTLSTARSNFSISIQNINPFNTATKTGYHTTLEITPSLFESITSVNGLTFQGVPGQTNLKILDNIDNLAMKYLCFRDINLIGKEDETLLIDGNSSSGGIYFSSSIGFDKNITFANTYCKFHSQTGSFGSWGDMQANTLAEWRSKNSSPKMASEGSVLTFDFCTLIGVDAQPYPSNNPQANSSPIYLAVDQLRLIDSTTGTGQLQIIGGYTSSPSELLGNNFGADLRFSGSFGGINVKRNVSANNRPIVLDITVPRTKTVTLVNNQFGQLSGTTNSKVLVTGGNFIGDPGVKLRTCVIEYGTVTDLRGTSGGAYKSAFTLGDNSQITSTTEGSKIISNITIENPPIEIDWGTFPGLDLDLDLNAPTIFIIYNRVCKTNKKPGENQLTGLFAFRRKSSA